MGQGQGLLVMFRVYELVLGVMGQGQDLGFSVMSQGQGYELVLVPRAYELGLGVMGQCYELGL